MGTWFSKPAPPDPLMETDWCQISWGENNDMKANLPKPAVKPLRILLVGPVGAGKSSFIKSLQSTFLNKMVNAACAVGAVEKSFTKEYTVYKFNDQDEKSLPFVIGDVMGLESERDSGVQPEDIINVLKGHIKEGYTFNPVKICPEQHPEYNCTPTLNDKFHCLVFVIPAGSFASDRCLDKMRYIREKACDLRIPHVVILTKVDEACPHVATDIKLIYRSKLIKKKVKVCSNALGIPESCIFPVRNYYEERQLKPDVDTVLLYTLTHILDYANDFVKNAGAMRN